MNTNNENGNSSIPEVAELVLEDGLTSEEIQSRIKEHNEKVADFKTKTTEANESLYARTKKAEGFVKDKEGKWVKPAANNKDGTSSTTQDSDKDTLSQADMMTIVRSNIPEEDVPEVVEYAKFKGISVAEAMKSSVVTTMLADNLEKRKVADGTATGTQRRGSGKVADDILLENASKGNLPDSQDDMKRLIELRKKNVKR